MVLIKHRLHFQPISRNLFLIPFQISIHFQPLPWERRIPPKASQSPIQILQSLWKVGNVELVCRSGVLRSNTDIVSSELLRNAKGEHVIIAKQAILALFRVVRSRTRRLSTPSPRTLKELYQAGFNGLNARMCRDLLYKWVAILRDAKRSLYIERPIWWPENVRYASPRELYGPGMCA